MTGPVDGLLSMLTVRCGSHACNRFILRARLKLWAVRDIINMHTSSIMAMPVNQFSTG